NFITSIQFTFLKASGKNCNVVHRFSTTIRITISAGEIKKLNTGAINRPAPKPEKPRKTPPTKATNANNAKTSAGGRFIERNCIIIKKGKAAYHLAKKHSIQTAPTTNSPQYPSDVLCAFGQIKIYFP